MWININNSRQIVYNYSMSSVILCNISDANSVIEDEKMSWISEVLNAIGVPESVYDIKDVDEYREKMEEIGVEVILITSGEIKIYKKIWHEGATEEQCGWLPATDECIVAHWKVPDYVMKLDGKNAYYEIHLNEWSILNMRKNI